MAGHLQCKVAAHAGRHRIGIIDLQSLRIGLLNPLPELFEHLISEVGGESLSYKLCGVCGWQFEAKNNMLDRQAQNNSLLLEELKALTERFQVPPEVSHLCCSNSI